jgi:membrane-associated phospholipid phosphatase
MEILRFITDFADQAVILALAAAATLGLALAGWRRGALAWALVVGATLGLILGAKLLTYACGGHLPPAWHLRSPSGHTGSAGVVAGGLVGLLTAARHRVALGLAAALAASLLIGATRLALGVHTGADVLAGAASALLGTASLLRLAGPRPARLRHLPAILALLLLTAFVQHGARLDAEARIRAQAGLFAFCTR